MFCKNCGKELSDKAKACISCGMLPKDGTAHCPTCGAETKDKQVICTACGSGLKSGYADGWSPIRLRFSITFAWSMALFILVVIFTLPTNDWFLGFIGSAIFSMLSGIIAMVFQTKQKIIYVTVSVFITFVIASIYGSMQ